MSDRKRIALFAAFLTACQSHDYQKNNGLVFGTVYHVTYAYHEDLQPEIEKALMTVDHEFSMFNEESTVSHLNRGED